MRAGNQHPSSTGVEALELKDRTPANISGGELSIALAFITAASLLAGAHKALLSHVADDKPGKRLQAASMFVAAGYSAGRCHFGSIVILYLF